MSINKKIIFVAAVCLFLCSCNNSNTKTIKQVQIMNEGVSNPESIDELKEAIAKYESSVEDLINAQEQIGIWYKILASRYIDNEMYAEALKALEKAIDYYPTNWNLYYYVGVSAGYMAKSALDFGAKGDNAKRDNYLLLAESGYKRAIELDHEYFRALYGLSVLYVLEMNQPAKAILLLEQALLIEPKNTDAMMLLGHAYYMTYNYESAVAMYDKIIQTSKLKEQKEAASANKKAVLDDMYE
ncbi:MAG: tetratricopeptide repeat protein [Treponema sp.]|jgi:tetratricopeptide (TPR) repeat protein|nr:tetratricopeptide repeat protein [Treponema sp.]